MFSQQRQAEAFPVAHPPWRLKTPSGSRNWADSTGLVRSEGICRALHTAVTRGAPPLRFKFRQQGLPPEPGTEFRSLSFRAEVRMLLFGLSAFVGPPVHPLQSRDRTG